MKKSMLVLAVVVLFGASAAYWYFTYFTDRGRLTTEPVYTGLERTVSANDLASNRDPAVILRFDPAYRHIGGQKFVLYGNANTEQHFFVETTTDARLKSVFWVQYEAYLPDKQHKYDYEDSPLRVTLDDYEFYTDTAVVESNPNRKAARGSDGAMARQFLASKGYLLPTDFAYARLVYLTDESRQKELMIIFIYGLARYGLTAAELKEGGAQASRWPKVERTLLDRIKDTLTVLPNGESQ